MDPDPDDLIPAPNTVPQAQVAHAEPGVEPQMTQEPDEDPYSRHLALILDIIPDVPLKYATELIEKHYPVYKEQVVEVVLQDLFDPTYLEVDVDAAGKQKAKESASDMEDVWECFPSKAGIDFASVDRPKPTGWNYSTLSFVSHPSSNGPPPLASHKANDQPCPLEPAVY